MLGSSSEEEEFAIVSSLKACARRRDLRTGARLHAHVSQRRGGGGVLRSHYLSSSLINMYAKCGALAIAKQVLQEIPHRHVTAWNALISGYASLGHGHGALCCYEEMQRECVSPDVVTFTSVLKACAAIRAAKKGKQLHGRLAIASSGLLKQDVALGNALVDMYAKCGMIAHAQEAMDELAARNVVTWSALMAGYLQHGQSREALDCFDRMRSEGIDLDAVASVCALRACAATRSMHKGEQVHDEIVRLGLLATESARIGAALVDMYAKCGVLAKAQEVFEELLVKDTVAWNALIAGYAREGQGWKALDCFRCMKTEGFSPDAATLACLSKACGSMRSLHMGERIHEEIASKGLLAKDAVLGNAVVDMYVKCGMLAKAEEVVLCELPIRDAVSWTSLIAGYVERGLGPEALACFERMQSEGISPDVVTFICILKACGITKEIGKGERIHGEITDRGLLRSSVILGTALVDMYVKCGALATARRVLLEELRARDVVSWVAVIAGYASEQGELDRVLSCFESMGEEGLPPTLAVFTCILKACGNVGAVDVGKRMHDEIVSLGLLEEDAASMLGTALVDMYARCGAIVRARDVLEELPTRDVASWSALIAGYAREGQGNEALECLSRMEIEGIAPDELTFASIVKAWAHEGLNPTSENRMRDLGHGYNNIAPSLEHHTSMVSGLGSIGRFDKAMEVIDSMPRSDARIELWLALMGACRKWGNVELARLSFDRALEIDRSCGASYVLMLEIFAAAGMQEDAASVEAMRSKHCVG